MRPTREPLPGRRAPTELASSGRNYPLAPLGSAACARLAIVLSLLLLAALPAAADAAKVRKGPSGTAFYTPPDGCSGKGATAG